VPGTSNGPTEAINHSSEGGSNPNVKGLRRLTVRLPHRLGGHKGVEEAAYLRLAYASSVWGTQPSAEGAAAFGIGFLSLVAATEG